MRQVFSGEYRVQCYLDIEAALARVQARLGLIPKMAADEIAAKCTLDIIDMAKLKTQTELIGYPVLPVVQQLAAACADHLGEYCHWGATTQDITDTPTILQIPEPPSLIEHAPPPISGPLAPPVSRYAHGGSQQSATGGPDHVRLQSRHLARGHPAAPATVARVASPCAGGRVRRGRGHPGLARRRRPGRSGGTDGRTRARSARDRLAHGTRPDRRGRLLPGTGDRDAGQDRDRCEVAHADRGRRGIRTLYQRSGLQQYDASEPQSDL